MYLYAAYIFDEPHERETDVGLVVEKAVEMGYQVRYWWLSNAIPFLRGGRHWDGPVPGSRNSRGCVG